MQVLTVGATTLNECENCLGLWLDVSSFEKICADREQQSAVLGQAVSMGQDQLPEPGKVRYVPCPECSNLMNRVNFARCSGVVVDICKGHGTWFDRDELSRIVEFIQSGGLQTSRKKEKIELEEERRRLQQERAALDRRRALTNEEGMNEGRLAGIASARGLLKLLMK
jgi:Zn-finger nucleic acid-binding protein